jgi:hypothetical protein
MPITIQNRIYLYDKDTVNFKFNLATVTEIPFSTPAKVDIDYKPDGEVGAQYSVNVKCFNRDTLHYDPTTGLLTKPN